MSRNFNIILEKPTIEMKEQALAYRQEHFDYGEKIINGSELLDKIENYEEWLEKVMQNSKVDTVSYDWVLTDTFFAITKKDRKIVGIIDLRYELNDFLKNFGNSGYSVRPTERKKGYATEMLAQVCEIAKAAGLKKLQLSVEKDNTASIRTIQKNGGIYERSFELENEVADIYQIQLL